MTSSAKITVSDYDSLLVDFNGFRLVIDAGENPLDWQKIVSKVDALLVPAPTGNATNNAWRGVEMSDMPIIGSALPKHLLKQLEDKNIAFITCHQSEKYEPVVLYKHLNEQVELYVLDGGQKLAHDSLQKAVEKEDPAAIEQAALKYGLIAALVWYPSKKDEPIKRILYTGNASYERVISALEKASSLTIFQYPVVTASMLPLKPLLTRNRVTSTIAADSRARPSVPRIAATVNKPISEKNASRMARPKANLPSNTVKDGFKVPTLPAPSRPNPINRKLFSKGNSSALIRAQPNTAKSLKPVKNVPVEKPCEKQSDQRQPPKNILPVAPSDIVLDKVPEIITLDDTMMNGVPETAQECTPSLDVENMPTETDEKCRDITGEQAPPMSDETLDFFSPQGNESIKVTESPSSLENSTTSEDTNRGSEDNGGDDMRLINISPYHRSVTKMSMSPNSSLISPDVLEDIKTADASIAGATIDVLHDMINKLSHENDGFVSANFNQLPNSRMHMAVTKVKPVLKNSRYFEAVFLPHSVAGVCNVDNLGDAGEFFSSVRSSMYIASGRELPGCLIPSWFAGKKSWKKPDTASVLCLTKSPNCVEMNEEEMVGEHCEITFTQNSTYTL